MPVKTIAWHDNTLVIIDQRMLPAKEIYLPLKTLDEVCDAIRTLAVRGAPAIGVAAAYGVVVAAREKTEYLHVTQAITKLAETRPTAVNLFYALNLMKRELESAFSSHDPVEKLLQCAHSVFEEDMRICRQLSEHGAELLNDGDTILTHCNAGALATSGFGTALGVIYAAVAEGKKITVFADETRPLLQGGRLTAWELAKNNVPVTVVCDNMAATILRDGNVDHVIVGADRIAANGDTANKIGTYGLSIAAKEHGVPFYIAAPLTSFDFSLSSGNDIPIEERSAEEIYRIMGISESPSGISYYNPAFDVTPSENITGIISEMGIARMPYIKSLSSWRTRWDEITSQAKPANN